MIVVAMPEVAVATSVFVRQKSASAAVSDSLSSPVYVQPFAIVTLPPMSAGFASTKSPVIGPAARAGLVHVMVCAPVTKSTVTSKQLSVLLVVSGVLTSTNVALTSLSASVLLLISAKSRAVIVTTVPPLARPSFGVMLVIAGVIPSFAV